MKLNFKNISKTKSYILRETTMCVDIRVYTCIKISIYIQIFLPGIGQMYMCSFLVTQWLSDRWKRFSLQQIVVSMVPWWALTYPEKGILAINGGGEGSAHKLCKLFLQAS